MKNKVKKICFVGVMLALSIVLSTFCQIKIFSDIRLDLSYTIIVIICYTYGALTGCIFAGSIALLNSTFFTAYGTSPSWILANMFIGLSCGLILHNIKTKKTALKLTIDITTIIISCAIGLLAIKTLVECKLYEIPFSIKIIKNAVAFATDTTLMLIGYIILIPIYNKLNKTQQTETQPQRGGYRL